MIIAIEDIWIGLIENLDIEKIYNAIITVLINIDWGGIAQRIFEFLGFAIVKTNPVYIAIKIAEYIKKGLDKAKEYFQKKVEECGGNVIEGVFIGITDALSSIGQWIIDNIFKPFIDGFKKAFEINSPSKVMIKMGGYIIDGLKEGLTGIWDKVKGTFDGLVSNISTKFLEAKNNVFEWGKSVKDKIKETWETASGKVREKASEIGQNIQTKFNNAKTTITTWAENVKTTWDKHWNHLSNSINLDNAKNTITRFKDDVSDKLSNLGEDAREWGSDLVDNLASGIRNNMATVTNAASSVANKIKSYLHFSEPDVGPLSNFHTYMPDMINLMVSGIRENSNKLTTELQGLTTDMSYIIKTPQIDSNSNIIKTNNLFADSVDKTNNINSNANIKIQIGAETLFDEFIEYINEKTIRTGKNVIVRVGD